VRRLRHGAPPRTKKRAQVQEILRDEFSPAE
jgi:hypothetical protein